MGPEGLEPSPARLRAGRAAANTLVPHDPLERSRNRNRPGRNRTSVARLSAECSPPERLAGRPDRNDDESRKKHASDGVGGIRTPTSRLKRPMCGRYTTTPIPAPRRRDGSRFEGFRIHDSDSHAFPHRDVRAATAKHDRQDSNPRDGGFGDRPRPQSPRSYLYPWRFQQPVRESNPPLRLERAVSSPLDEQAVGLTRRGRRPRPRSGPGGARIHLSTFSEWR